MSIENSDTPDPTDDALDQQAGAMRDQLRGDVAAWSAARAEARQNADIPVPAAPPAVRRPARRAAQAKPAAPSTTDAAAPKKGFSMSYGGATTADYTAYIRSRRAR